MEKKQKAEKVALAKKTLLSKLQTQTIINVHIPKEHHKHILGKGGKALLTLTTKTATKIHVPKAEENTDVITITGTRENCEKARHEIQAASDEMVSV